MSYSGVTRGGGVLGDLQPAQPYLYQKYNVYNIGIQSFGRAVVVKWCRIIALVQIIFTVHRHIMEFVLSTGDQ